MRISPTKMAFTDYDKGFEHEASHQYTLPLNASESSMLRDGLIAPIMPPNSDVCAAMIGLLSMGLDPSEAPSLRLEDFPTPPRPRLRRHDRRNVLCDLRGR